MVYVGELHLEHLLEPVFTLIQLGVSCKWAYDSQRFLLEFSDIIQNSPSQIYHFALPFCPPSSWLYKYYAAGLSQGVKVVKGLPARWGSCFRTFTSNSENTSLACWKDTVAMGINCCDIAILNAVTGNQVAVLSGHTCCAKSITFSSDGMSLVSGSCDKTLKLWDIQTGGIIKTFHGHSHRVLSVSISCNYATIASGSDDNTIRLWDIQTGECCHIIGLQESVLHVTFSPINPQHLISVSDDEVQQWDTGGHQIKPTYQGYHAVFSLDGAHLVLCGRKVTAVHSSDSGAIVAKYTTDDDPQYCCLSPDGKFIAVAAGSKIFVWDISGSHPHLLDTFIGHVVGITFLAFSSSSLISASKTGSIKYWQIGASSSDMVESDQPASIDFVNLQAENRIAVSGDLHGVVKIWDISTGLCKASFQSPVGYSFFENDARVINGRLIVVWYDHKTIHIWDAEGRNNIWSTKKGKLLRVIEVGWSKISSLRISGDGSKVFLLKGKLIQAWSMRTGEAVGEVELKNRSHLELFSMGGSRISVRLPNSSTQEWDFGIPGSPPVPLPNPSTEKPHLDFIGGAWYEGLSWIKDTVTGKEVFQLAGRYAIPLQVQWDGQYLVAGYRSGEVLILDFN
jgi:WD40 repeat protein